MFGCGEPTDVPTDGFPAMLKGRYYSVLQRNCTLHISHMQPSHLFGALFHVAM